MNLTDGNRMLIIGILCFFAGIIMTLMIAENIVTSFDGIFQNMNVTVAINETRLVEEMNKTLIDRAKAPSP